MKPNIENQATLDRAAIIAAAQTMTETVRKQGYSLEAKHGGAIHFYTTSDGAIEYARLRLKHPGNGEQWIRPLRRNLGCWNELKAPEFEGGAPLYNLHQLCDPMRQSERGIFVEGEFKVDMLVARGIITTTSGGAQSAETADFDSAAGRAWLIWPDNDKPGFVYARHVADKLKALGCEVAFVDVAALNLPPKGDVVDWLKAFQKQHGRKATAEDIWALPVIEGTPEKIEAIGSDLSHSIASGEANPLPQSFAPLPIVQITCAADIKPVSVSWLWDGWLARGKMHIFAGQAGTGKTTIALALAATVSKGGRFPDGTKSPVGDVMIWSGEDSPEDTLVPRLIASGADMSRVHFVGDVRHGDAIRSFDPATDIQALTDAATRIGDVSMLIVDPVVSAVQGDSHKNGEVRRALQPLVDFGEKLGCAVLGISHFSKGTNGKDPLERVSGSLAFGALARIVLATAKTTEGESTKRIFCRAKSNIGADHGGYEYDLEQIELATCKGLFASYAVWGAAVEGSARELLAELEPDNDDGGGVGVDGVTAWLQTLLKEEGGKLDRRDVMKAANAMGYKERTVHRAREKLGIVVEQNGFGKDKRSIWTWVDSTIHASIVPIVPDKKGGIYGTHGGKHEDLPISSDVWEVQ
jgi:putative DNA primase/helicase